MPNSVQTWLAAIRNDPTITAQARPPDTLFGSRFPIATLRGKPANGSKGMRASTGSPFQRGEGLGVERLPMAEQRDDQRETDRGLGRGHRHDEEGDDLAVH